MQATVFDPTACGGGAVRGSTIAETVAAALERDTPASAAAYLFAPVPLRRVMRDFWGRHPFVVHRLNASYWGSLLPIEQLQQQLDSGALRYGLELDVAHYDEAGGRSTQNKGQSAVGPEAATCFSAEGCSLRFLHPQRRCDALFELCSALERYFDNNVGANAVRFRELRPLSSGERGYSQ
jgi:hypothetical protein